MTSDERPGTVEFITADLPRGHVIVVRDPSAGPGWRVADTTVWVRLADAYECASRAFAAMDWVICPIGLSTIDGTHAETAP